MLDIGAGSGYLTHVLANLVSPDGVVVGVEHIRALVEMAESNTGKSAEGRRLLESGRVRYVMADGRKGYPESGAFPASVFSAARSNVSSTGP